MGSTRERGSLQVQPRKAWSEAEEYFLFHSRESHRSWTEISKSLPGRSAVSCSSRYYDLRNRREGGKEAKHKLAILYERGKADMWAPIAARMAVAWSEAERIHWMIGKTQMAERGSYDFFPTTRFNLLPPHEDDTATEVRARRQKQGQQQQEAAIPGSAWSEDEETLLFAQRRSKISWDEIAKFLPGRTAASCQSHHSQQSTTGPAWHEERTNKLCQLYVSLKSSMWAKIGEELKAALMLAPRQDDIDDGEVYQHRNQEHQHPQSQIGPAPMAHVGQHGRSVTLPSFLEFTAGVDLLWQPPQRER
ncbi:related to DRPLA protein [Claviceps purpurea 20.1]|uniref:Related to DRPLA protein n=1 Tax=Claviceps purpurea (strain 20.1) TaxID=1111077 RepID=M1WAQ3_CLAP2|nr:related to DRPLA protein [Claviceps purpurea 20.1]